MDDTNLRNELVCLLEKEIGFTGKFILEKQCARLNIDPDHINPHNLKPLSEQIHWAVKGFTGEKKAEERRRGILEYKNALDTISSSIRNKQDTIDAVNAQITIADKKLMVGLGDEAVEAVRRALEIFSESELKDDVALETRIKRNLAKALGSTKEGREEAIEMYEEVVGLGEASENYYEVALAWTGTATLSWRAGKHQDALQKNMLALRALKRVKATSKRDKDKKKRAEGRIHLGLGNTYLDLLDFELSISHNEAAIEIFMEQGDYASVGLTYNNLSRVYEETGQYSRAIDGYERGIRNCNRGGSLRMEGWTLTNLASTLVEAGRAAEALPYLERAEKLLANFRDGIAHSKLHCMYGKYHREMGNWKEAAEHFRKSIDFAKPENSPDYLALAEEEFGIMYCKQGKKDDALPLLKSALKWYEKKKETARVERINKILADL